VTNTILVALCSDRVLRVWDLESTNMLKGIAIENVGRPICFNFSKNDGMLLIGTSDGVVQAWDGESLGVKNTRVMSQKISNTTIKSLCWFHYAG
jgi:WD40 repeat protein